MWETWVWFLGWEDTLEKGKATTPVFCPGEFQGLYRSWGRKELDMTEPLSLSLSNLAEDSFWHFPFSHRRKWRKRVRITHRMGLLIWARSVQWGGLIIFEIIFSRLCRFPLICFKSVHSTWRWLKCFRMPFICPFYWWLNQCWWATL